MKHEEIVWRLKEQPTSASLQGLVANGLLTKEEARQILFSTRTEEDRDKKSLESEIKFLRELVEKLSQNRSQIVEVIKEIKVPYYQQPWYKPYYYWCDGGSITLGTTTCSSDNLMNLNATSTTASNFSDIKTF